uniref:Uncharacterized protein n=1 Tax=Oryza brachyantha TaxID=4533 RepID=J3M805_ORYBR
MPSFPELAAAAASTCLSPPRRSASTAALPSPNIGSPIYEKDVARVVCNPLSGQLLRLPDIGGSSKTTLQRKAGILTQTNRGDQRKLRRPSFSLGNREVGRHGRQCQSPSEYV